MLGSEALGHLTMANHVRAQDCTLVMQSQIFYLLAGGSAQPCHDGQQGLGT